MAGTEVIYFPFGLQLPRRQDFLNYFPPEPVANSPPLAIPSPTVLSLRIPGIFSSRLTERNLLNESGCLCRDISVESQR